MLNAPLIVHVQINKVLEGVRMMYVNCIFSAMGGSWGHRRFVSNAWNGTHGALQNLVSNTLIMYRFHSVLA